ncbi:MAG TPA: PEP-CTERM sorting domain-containing protein, partial [Candidatus Methylacidiphilales bacterium]
NSTTATADKIVVTGNLVIGAGTLLSGTDLGTGSFAAGTVINLLSYTGTLTGTFNGYADGSSITVGSNTYTINYGTAVANEITLTFAAVPEPSTWALLGIGSALLAARFRKRLSATA